MVSGYLFSCVIFEAVFLLVSFYTSLKHSRWYRKRSVVWNVLMFSFNLKKIIFEYLLLLNKLWNQIDQFLKHDSYTKNYLLRQAHFSSYFEILDIAKFDNPKISRSEELEMSFKKIVFFISSHQRCSIKQGDLKRCSKKFHKIYRKILVPESPF